MALVKNINKIGVWAFIGLSCFLVGPWMVRGGEASEPPPSSHEDGLGGSSEVLPEPQELRGSRRPSYRPQSVFEYTGKDRRANIRRPSSSIAQDFLETDEDLYGVSGSLDNDFAHLPQSSSHIDSYASEDGYGHSCSPSFVNASAVALLAFLFLLNLVQDIIQEITAQNMMEEMEGRSRSKRNLPDEEADEAMQFIQNGGLGAMKEELPTIVIPLMIKLSNANESECLLRPICEANAQLALNYGQVGKVFATLLSNIASQAFSNQDTRTFSLAQKAASRGRNEGVCDLYSVCRPKMPP